VPLPSAFVPGLSPDIDALVARCMAKSPRERYATMREVADACGALLARPSVMAVTIASPDGLLPRVTVPAEPPAQPTSRRGRLLKWLAVGVVAAGVATVIALVTAGKAPSVAGAATPSAATVPTPPAASAPPPPPAAATTAAAAPAAPAPSDAAESVASEPPAPPPAAPPPVEHTTAANAKHGAATGRAHASNAKPVKPRAPHAGSGSTDLYDDR
jgi:serine/threonine-protein kinase